MTKKIKVFDGLWIDPSKDYRVIFQEVKQSWYADYSYRFQVQVYENEIKIYSYLYDRYRDAAKEVDKINEVINKSKQDNKEV